MKLALKIIAGLLLLLGLTAAYIQLAPPPTFDVPVPEVQIINPDSAMLAHGEYLVYGAAHCAGCHCKKGDREALFSGQKVSFAGGYHFPTPIGKIYIPNITPDPETGIGNMTDGEIIRAFRYSVRGNGHAMVPVMPFTYMSESDAMAIVAYLRSQQPVKNFVPDHDFNLMGNLYRKFMLKPVRAEKPIPQHVEPSPTAQYGDYLVNNVANSMGCHTTFNMNTMQFDGVPLSGGAVMEEKDHIFKSPNLTPDPMTGHIYNWSEDQFVARFKAGTVFEDSPMPWEMFKTMREDDIRAIFKYLQTVEPCVNKVEPIVAARE